MAARLRRLRVGLYTLAIVGFCISALWSSASRTQLEAAFRNAWRDSFATDISSDVAIATALKLGGHSGHVETMIEDSGFICAKATLVRNNLWVCQRWAWHWHDVLPKHERWTIEFDCNAKLAQCTIETFYAEVR